MTLKYRSLAQDRRGQLKAMLAEGRKLRAIEAHNPLSALIGSAAAYNFVTDEELFARGAAIVIHANHQLRAAYQAMAEVCANILEHDRSREADALCVGLPEPFELIGTGA